jgi:hypothetical protein
VIPHARQRLATPSRHEDDPRLASTGERAPANATDADFPENLSGLSRISLAAASAAYTACQNVCDLLILPCLSLQGVRHAYLALVGRYRKIFASYSHKDLHIVEQIEHLARALGDEYLRDWKHLRAGEVGCAVAADD